MRRTIPIAASAALVLMSVVLGPPASATVERVPMYCEAVPYQLLSGGTYWVSGNVEHLRGAVLVLRETGSQYCQGYTTIVASYDLNLVTMKGSSRGTFIYDLDAYEGGFEGTFSETSVFSGEPLVYWSGTIVGNGYGELVGWQERALSLGHGRSGLRLPQRGQWVRVQPHRLGGASIDIVDTQRALPFGSLCPSRDRKQGPMHHARAALTIQGRRSSVGDGSRRGGAWWGRSVRAERDHRRRRNGLLQRRDPDDGPRAVERLARLSRGQSPSTSGQGAD